MVKGKEDKMEDWGEKKFNWKSPYNIIGFVGFTGALVILCLLFWQLCEYIMRQSPGF